MSSDISTFTGSQTTEEVKEDSKLFRSNISLNELIVMGQCIEAAQIRGKIKVFEMASVGMLYNRISSHIDYIQISNKEERTDQENERFDKLLKILEVIDLQIFYSFFNEMKERELFKDEEKETIDDLEVKLSETVKQFEGNNIENAQEENKEVIKLGENTENNDVLKLNLN